MREFSTAAKEATEVDEGSIITIDDRDCRVYKPTGGQYAMFMSASNGRFVGTGEKVAGIIDFFLGLFGEEDQAYLAHRLMDREDPFEIDDILEIINGLSEEWAGRPTRSSSGSTRSRRTGGRKSTAVTLTATS